MHRKPLRQQRPLPVPQMLQPSPSRTPRALPLPTPRPKLEDSSASSRLGNFTTSVHQTQPQREPNSPIVPRPPTPARTPHNPPALGNHRRESPAARPSTIRRERAFTVTIGADFHRRCAGTPPRDGKGSVMIIRQGPRHRHATRHTHRAPRAARDYGRTGVVTISAERSTHSTLRRERGVQRRRRAVGAYASSISARSASLTSAPDGMQRRRALLAARFVDDEVDARHGGVAADVAAQEVAAAVDRDRRARTSTPPPVSGAIATVSDFGLAGALLRRARGLAQAALVVGRRRRSCPTRTR